MVTSFGFWESLLELFIFGHSKNVQNRFPFFTFDTKISNFCGRIYKIIVATNFIMKNVFITFGGPTSNYHNSVNRITNEAFRMDFFTEICGYTEQDLISDGNFWSTHGNFIQTNLKGYGYWIWKPYFICKKLKELDYGDILIYCDCGCEVNTNGKKRLLEYIELLENDPNNYGILAFNTVYLEQHVSKKELFDYLQFNDNVKVMTHNIATVIIIKKTPHSENVINKWFEVSQNYDIINDNKHMVQDINFLGHHHDQSIFSVLVNNYGCIKTLTDETYYINWNDGINFPFLAKRIR